MKKPKEINQDKLVDLMKSLGFLSDTSLCAGFSMMALLAFLANEFHLVCLRLNQLDSFDLANKIKTTLTSRACNRSSKFPPTEIQQLLIDFYIFCEGIEIFHNTKKYREWFDDPHINTESVAEIIPLTESVKLKEMGGCVLVDRWINLYDIDEWVEYLETLTRILQYHSIDFTMTLESIEHRSCLFYANEQKQWLLVDINYLPYLQYSINECPELADKVFEFFSIDLERENKNYLAIETRIFAAGKNQGIIHQILESFKCTTSFQSMHEIIPIKGVAQSFHKVTFAYLAAFYDYPEIIKSLASVEGDLNAKTHFKDTPLATAISQSHINVLKVLLQYVDVNKVPIDHHPPTWHAISNGNIEILKLLLQHGAKTNIQLPNNDSLATFAIKNKQKAMLVLLAQYGEDLSRKDGNGFTPLATAKKEKDRSIIQLLQKHLPKSNPRIKKFLKHTLFAHRLIHSRTKCKFGSNANYHRLDAVKDRRRVTAK